MPDRSSLALPRLSVPLRVRVRVLALLALAADAVLAAAEINYTFQEVLGPKTVGFRPRLVDEGFRANEAISHQTFIFVCRPSKVWVSAPPKAARAKF